MHGCVQYLIDISNSILTTSMPYIPADVCGAAQLDGTGSTVLLAAATAGTDAAVELR
jgi:hypothetical protein